MSRSTTMTSLGDLSLKSSNSSDDTIVVIVGGVKHETCKSTLMTLPGSRLTGLMDTETPPTEVCFDRHPEVFTHVLQYYRSGKLHCSTNLCGVLLEEEFAFWGISISDVEPCCWAAFQKHRDAAEALAQIDPSEKNSDPREKSSKPWQSKLWALFDDPYSSTLAMVIAVTSLLFILLSVTAFCLETNRTINPLLQPSANNTSESFSGHISGTLDTIELVCSLWFIVEFLIRVASCPSKCRFFMNVLNIVDLLALFPWFFRWCSGYHCVWILGFLHVMRCLRFLRVFKLMQHVLGVRVLIYTLRASAATLCAIPLALFSCTIIFGVMIYYAELLTQVSGPFFLSHFQDIPMGFWWAVVTLTTVGYGDLYPMTVQGQFVGALCAAVGVFLIVLPVPVIVNNFLIYYPLVKAKYSMPRKSEKSDGEISSSG